MRSEGIREGRLRSFDGTEIATFRQGHRGRWLLLANGLGGNVNAWVHQLRHFDGRVRFATWDYRGLYKSGPPANRSVTIDDHVGDAQVVMQEYGIKDAVVIGWSMGVQVALELYRRHPESVAALVLLNGTHGRPLQESLARSWGPITCGLRAVGRAAPAVLRAVGPLAQSPLIPKAIKATGLVSGTLDETVFRGLAAEFVTLDFDDYVQIFLELARHDAREILPTIQVPTLVFTGGRDFLTPSSMGAEMADRIPGAERTHVPGASHYTCVEFPDVVNHRIETFLQDHKLL